MFKMKIIIPLLVYIHRATRRHVVIIEQSQVCIRLQMLESDTNSINTERGNLFYILYSIKWNGYVMALLLIKF